MTFTQAGNSVTLEMTREQYDELLMMLGYAFGAVPQHNKELFWRCLRFVNEMNRTNPEFTPYEIPPMEEW